ncbi:hypothetical protein HY502_03975 [Candidatus Woesebacteria bacterium]|nr:hypothetical protein [Candidatus Woesebacteria bacterium]
MTAELELGANPEVSVDPKLTPENFAIRVTDEIAPQIERYSLTVNPELFLSEIEEKLEHAKESSDVAEVLGEAVVLDDPNLAHQILSSKVSKDLALTYTQERIFAAAVAKSKANFLEKQGLSGKARRALEEFKNDVRWFLTGNASSPDATRKRQVAGSLRKRFLKNAALTASALLLAACGVNASAGSPIPDTEPLQTASPTAFEPGVTRTPSETPTPTETVTATEIVVSEPTAEEVADFTPETIPDRFIHFNHEWAKTTIEEKGEQIEVWKTVDEGMENVDMRFVTLYEHYIKDMFIEHTDLGRFHLYVTPEAPFRLRFPNDPNIGETIINQYLLPKMKEPEAKQAVASGAEVYVVWGNNEKNKLPRGSDTRHAILYSPDGKDIIGELMSFKGTGWSETGPYVNKDGTVIFGFYGPSSDFAGFVSTRSPAPLSSFAEWYASTILGSGSSSEGGLPDDIDKYLASLVPLTEYLVRVSRIAWFDD